MYSKLFNKIIFILAVIFMGVRINFIGSISLTEIFVLFYSPYLFVEFRRAKIPFYVLYAACFLH